MLGKELSAQMQGASHVWLPKPAAVTSSAFPSVSSCQVSASAAAQDPFFSKCQSLFHWRTHSVKSLTTSSSFSLACCHACRQEKMSLWLRSTDGLAVQTISVPIHAVDLLCDPQYIAYSRSVLRFSLERPFTLPDLTGTPQAWLGLGTDNQRNAVRLTRSNFLGCSNPWHVLSILKKRG